MRKEALKNLPLTVHIKYKKGKGETVTCNVCVNEWQNSDLEEY